MKQELLRQLPQVEKVLGWPDVESLVALHSRTEIVRGLRKVLDELRAGILIGDIDDKNAEQKLSQREIVCALQQALQNESQSSYRRVINGTGILLHTGLGRAALPTPALQAIQDNLSGYSLVEVDVHSGERNQREQAVSDLLCELTGAEAATVVNNNAAATLIILAALARDKEVIISRGQLVEIGGSFRIPDILKESGARLVEVGTTNRTYARDYRQAITPETGLLLDVHTSNYEIRGFCHSTPLSELVELGREHEIPVVSDLGSGCFVDVAPFGFRREPLVAESVADQPDLICFSGDKLLGGPQAGLIVGSKEAVARVRRHPMYRCMRPDKVTLTILEATLKLYRDPETMFREIPALRALKASAEDIHSRVQSFVSSFESDASKHLEIRVRESTSEMGSGSLPAQEIPSWSVGLRHSQLSPEQLSEALRSSSPPVFSRIHDGWIQLDFRTVQSCDEATLSRIITELGNRKELGKREGHERLSAASDRMIENLPK